MAFQIDSGAKAVVEKIPGALPAVPLAFNERISQKEDGITRAETQKDLSRQQDFSSWRCYCR